MNKKIISLLALMLTIFVISGCDANNMQSTSDNADKMSDITIERVDFSPQLVADKDTSIVYYENYTAYGKIVLLPYIGENGNYCKYVDGQIKEID